MNPGRLAALLCSFALSACTYVTVPAPLGDSPVVIEPKEWDGHWYVNEHFAGYVIVTDAERGALELSWIEKRQRPYGRQQAELVSADVLLRRTGDITLASMRVRGEDAYMFFAVSKDADRATIWVPNLKCIEQQVKIGVLSGRKLNYELALARLDAVQVIARDSTTCPILAWDKPGLARRLPKED